MQLLGFKTVLISSEASATALRSAMFRSFIHAALRGGGLATSMFANSGFPDVMWPPVTEVD